MFLAFPEASAIVSEDQRNLGALVNEVLDQRCCLNNTALEPNAKILRVDIFCQTRVKHDRDATLVLRCELTNGEPARARGGLPIDVTQFVPRLIITQHQQIVTRAATERSRLSTVQRQQV